MAVGRSWNTVCRWWGEGKDAGNMFYSPRPGPVCCLSSVPLLQSSGSKPSLFCITLVSDTSSPSFAD